MVCALLAVSAGARAETAPTDRELELDLLEQQVAALDPATPVRGEQAAELPFFESGGPQCTEGALLARVAEGDCATAGFVVRPDGTLTYDREGGASFCFAGDWGATAPTVLAWTGEGGPTEIRCVGAVVAGKRYDLVVGVVVAGSPVLHVQVWTQRPPDDALAAATRDGALAQGRATLARAGRLGDESADESPSEEEIQRALAETFLARTVELRLSEAWPLAGRVVALRSGAGERAPLRLGRPSEPTALLGYDLRSGGAGEAERLLVSDGQHVTVSPGERGLPPAVGVHMWAHGSAAPDALALQKYDEALKGGGTDLDAWESLSTRTRSLLGHVSDESIPEAERVSARHRNAARRAALKALDERAGEVMNHALRAHAAPWAVRQVADAPFTTQVLLQRANPGAYEFAICRAGATCDGSAAPRLDELTADLPIRVQRHRRIGFAIELAVDGQIGGSIDYGGYAFTPVGGGEGPSRFYQLQGNNRFSDHLTSSLLLVVYPFANARHPCMQGWFVGAGTSLFEGTTAHLFKQLDLRFGVELAHGLLLSTGPSFRSVDVPADLAPGTVVAVGVNDSAPSFGTTPRATFAWSIGLAADLALIGDAVKLVGGAFTGGASDRGNP